MAQTCSKHTIKRGSKEFRMNEKQLTEKPCDMSHHIWQQIWSMNLKKQPCPLNPWTAELETIKKAYEF